MNVEYGGEPLLCGYTARQLLDLERAASEAKETLTEIIGLATGASHTSRFVACGEIARQAQVALGPLSEALGDHGA